MRFAFWPSPTWSWNEILEFTRHCESTGWDGVYFPDHFMPADRFVPNSEMPTDGDTLECWSVLAAIAALVPRLRLGSLVTSVTFRHPAVLAKIASAVDHISGGRLTLGVGAGWYGREHALYGLPLGAVTERLDRLEEACAILTSMLCQPRTSFSGRFFAVSGAPNQPAPLQRKMPLLVGGGGERRTMRIAARYADEWNTWSTPDVLASKVAVLSRHAQHLGRNPADIRVSTQAMLFLSADERALEPHRSGDPKRPTLVGTPAEVLEILGAYRDAGADEFVVPTFNCKTMTEARDVFDLFIQDVATPFRNQ